MSALAKLKQYSTVVADTGDFEAMKAYKPTHATTNPSIILSTATMDQYQYILDKAIQYGKNIGSNLEEQVSETLDRLSILFGLEILKIVPGTVSLQIPVRLSYNKEGSIAKAIKFVDALAEFGISKERVLIKLAATWEGIQAAKILEEKHGVHCNMTLVFSIYQAVACAEANITMIAPFVGRILEWDEKPKEDPILFVTKIYNYFKKFSVTTQIMGAYLRNTEEILELSGVDLLTIIPKLLEELANSDKPVKRNLDPKYAAQSDFEKISLNEDQFRWHMNEDAMATVNVSEGIRRFAADTRKLETLIKGLIAKSII